MLGAALALTLIGYDRLASVTALVFVATLVADPAWRDETMSRRELMVVPVICFITLALSASMSLSKALNWTLSRSRHPERKCFARAKLLLRPAMWSQPNHCCIARCSTGVVS